MNQTPPATTTEPTNQTIVPLSSGRVNFTLENGQTFSLAILAFLKDLTLLWEQSGGDHAEYCAAVGRRVGELNPGIVLSMDEADNLIASVNELAVKKKAKQRESLKALQLSALSMGSSPDT